MYVDLRVMTKENLYSKYTKVNEKERNINNLNYKGREREEINWRTTKTPGKQQHENTYVPINNYFKYKLVENVNWYNHCGGQYEDSSKKLGI